MKKIFMLSLYPVFCHNPLYKSTYNHSVFGAKKRQKRHRPPSVPFSSLCSFHCFFVIFCICEDLVLPRVLFLYFCALQNVCEDEYIHCKGQYGNNSLCGRFCDGRHAASHGCCDAALSVYGSDCCKTARILEQREYLREHAPKCQRVGTVLYPAAFVPECCCKGRCEQKCETAVPGMCRQVQICILEIPDVICKDIYPDHVRPKHIFFVF